METMKRLNDEIRVIASDRSLCLYDFDRAVWQGRDSADALALFRDDRHPNENMSAQHANKLLEINEDGDKSCKGIVGPYPVSRND